MCHEIWPGDIGYITYMHAVLYAPEQGWDHTFEAYVAVPLSEFARSKSSREKIWILEDDDRIAGSVAIVKRAEEEAQLRWLLLEPEIRGRGFGRWLVEEALDFSRDMGYESIVLWTAESLPIAEKLYRSVGFEQILRVRHERWGSIVNEVKYRLVL
ncbi:GNAT family N-acetyltransferase [Methanothrix soehngenii]|uniref:GNAT family N-acetyltransferase n=1 Tax=Methanothrix soehngenii TaxID=2223 RepID=UPI002351FE26|nr:GNAT family N-acetyltransferase [Methanothrix soehngenii]